jgi:hypothetical protein
VTSSAAAAAGVSRVCVKQRLRITPLAAAPAASHYGRLKPVRGTA